MVARPNFTKQLANYMAWELYLVQLLRRSALSTVNKRGSSLFFLAEALKLDTKNVENPGFNDVPTSHTYYGHIAALATQGIIQKGTNYNPNNYMKRSQMAKILTLGFNLQQATTLSAPFADFTEDVETNQYIQTLLNYGITEGTSSTTFSPYMDIGRGQMALFLYRTLQKK